MSKTPALWAALMLSAAPFSSFAAYVTLGTFNCPVNGCQPEAGVAVRVNTLYGPTVYGSLYKFPLSAGPISSQHLLNNSPEGAKPVAALTWHASWFYGTAEAGGNLPNGSGNGTIFRIKPNGNFQLLYQFSGGVDGRQPFGQLLYSTFNTRPVMYGTTMSGGVGFGSLYMFDLTGLSSIVATYDFQGGLDGGNPTTGLIQYNNMFYGTTSTGGMYNAGTLFMIDPTLTTKTILHDFGGPNDGTTPSSRLLLHNNLMFGTTAGGGIAGSTGTVYAFDPVNPAEAVACNFNLPNGGTNPSGDLAWRAGKIYGTTEFGGVAGGGTVFKCNPITQSQVSLHDLGTIGTDGSHPTSGVILNGGLLYGTTLNNPGTIFSETP